MQATRKEAEDFFTGEFEYDLFEYHCDVVIQIGRLYWLDRRWHEQSNHGTQLGVVGRLGRLTIDPEEAKLPSAGGE